MMEMWLNWNKRIAIVGLIGLLVLLGSSKYMEETKDVRSGWWVQHQRMPHLSCQRVKKKVKLPRWYICLQRIIQKWKSRQREGIQLRLVIYVLSLMAVVWVRLLRWVISQREREGGETDIRRIWGWTSRLPKQASIMQVRLQVEVFADREQERNSTPQAKQVVMCSSQNEARRVYEGNVEKEGSTSQLRKIEVRVQRSEGQPSYRLTDQSRTGSETEKGNSLLNEPGQASLSEKRPSVFQSAISDHFGQLDDPRVERTKKHQLQDIVTIAICAVISGANTWVEVELFGKAKQTWLKTLLELANGIPSHDTFGRVFRRLDPQQWQDCFLSWVQAINKVTSGQIVPIDGKTLRRSHDKPLGKEAIHMVSAWASASGLVLGQVKTDEKSNEISAIPSLLELLEISGCIITIDAMGCQKNIASLIVDKKADYVLALKENQPHLYQDVSKLFHFAHTIGFVDLDYCKTTDYNHGRHETRECWTISDPDCLSNLRSLSAWKNLNAIVMIKSQRLLGSKKSTHYRYYISSLDGDAKQLLHAVRTHWSIENQLHWVLDVAFCEDLCRIRKGFGAQNFAVLRHIALNLLGQDTTTNCGFQAKRKTAGWDQNYLLHVLSGFT